MLPVHIVSVVVPGRFARRLAKESDAFSVLTRPE